MDLSPPPDLQTVRAIAGNGVLRLTLDRPAVRNAINLAMVNELSEIVAGVSPSSGVRAVVIRGAGGHFCAGGDIGDAQALENTADPVERRRLAIDLNRRFGLLLARISHCPVPVIAVIEGAAVGGGVGLVCAADVALAVADARFRLPEVTLGLPPAQIAPYVVQRISFAHARRLCLAAPRISGTEAGEIGLVDRVFPDAESMEAGLAALLDDLNRCAPDAVAATKRLLLDCRGEAPEMLTEKAALAWSDAVLGDEGQEGLAAFRHKRDPAWRSG